jgi:predicted amidohydrolase
VIERARIRVLAYVNIVGSGMGGEWEHDVREMRPALAAAMAEEHRDVVVGIKTAHYWAKRPFDAEHPPWAAVDAAVEAAERCGLPVMVDFYPWLPERPYPDLILDKLRPGDIHTHVFAQQFPVIDMATTMSKVLAMGVPLVEVIARSTIAPAREIGRPELGTLSPGAEADVAVLALDKGVFAFVDCGQSRLESNQRLRCVLTVRAGEIVYNPLGLGLPFWRQATN